MTRVSVVIPTHNRRAVLQRAIESLAAQSYAPHLVEVIVVADGCTDGTERMVINPPLAGRVLAQAHRGPAAARNTGAAAAHGDLLIFLDDDVEASPGLIEAHVRAQKSVGTPALVIGHLPSKPEYAPDLFRIALRSWWDAMFERMRQPGHRFTYADVLSGNCSIPRDFFDMLGGFEERLRCHEDFELGYRALRAGAVVLFESSAAGWHDDMTDLARALWRKREEGVADVWLAREHRELWPALPLAKAPGPSRRARLLQYLASSAPVPGDMFDIAARGYLRLLSRARARHRWRIVLDDLLFYSYWRGVAQALQETTFDRFRKEMTSSFAPRRDPHELDLTQGLAGAMRELDAVDAPGVVLQYRNVRVGTIEPQPWAEPLRGRHLPDLLRTTFNRPFADALVSGGGLEAIAAPTEHVEALVSRRSRASRQ